MKTIYIDPKFSEDRRRNSYSGLLVYSPTLIRWPFPEFARR